jgi:predicted CoA-binding protein
MKHALNEGIADILSQARTIAVVGISEKPYRTSYAIAEELHDAGYTVIPVNPGLTEWNGITAYPDLRSIPVHVDIVNVFRRSEYVSEITDDAIAIGAGTLWTQFGVVDMDAARRALDHGLRVVMDRCISIELSLIM